MIATESKEPIIRIATLEDAEQALDIYAPYVLKTAVTFEWEVPSLEEFRAPSRSYPRANCFSRCLR